ncbi:hypothetical protein FISHEDRAFT_57857 [Fistulina hepatica ATCC 64428]|uniref:Uncharacterized protein n=1 Tax=Fistulina hepatica ATCC 64428 TaxID=1128425 RepID=A0A0D7AFS0_9AGAR|nr:hypothetical protein FISHEDRAFT_57857 [Fistulina hepatica ATCC 64428]
MRSTISPTLSLPSASASTTGTVARSKRTPVPLLLEAFPAPPTFIPQTPIPITPSSSFSSPNPPPSLPPSSPLPPVPGPSRISEHEGAILLASTKRQRCSSKISATSHSSDPSHRDSVISTDSSGRGGTGTSSPHIASDIRACSSQGASSSRRESFSSALSVRSNFSRSPLSDTSIRLDHPPSLYSRNSATPDAMDRCLRLPAKHQMQLFDISDVDELEDVLAPNFTRSAAISTAAATANESISSIDMQDLPKDDDDLVDGSQHVESSQSQSPIAMSALALHQSMRAFRSRSNTHKTILRSRAPSSIRGSPATASPVSASPVTGSPAPSTFPFLSAAPIGNVIATGVLNASLSKAELKQSATDGSGLKKLGVERKVTCEDSKASPEQQEADHGRAESPDIDMIISRTPRPRRKSSSHIMESSRSRSRPCTRRQRVNEGTSVGGRDSAAQSSSGRVSGGGGTRERSGTREGAGRDARRKGKRVSPPFDDSNWRLENSYAGDLCAIKDYHTNGMIDDYPSLVPSEYTSTYASDEDVERGVYYDGGDLDGFDEGLDDAALAHLERELDGDATDSDSSIDLHTPLPELMLQHGHLSSSSKLLPKSRATSTAGSREEEMRPESMFSVSSAITKTKSGLTKDERDTPQRRVRHRDGRLLRGGLGLTTGLGWSDSEDEDAPSPLTSRLSHMAAVRQSMISHSSSAVSLKSSKSSASLRHGYSGDLNSYPSSRSATSLYRQSTASNPHPLSRSYGSAELLEDLSDEEDFGFARSSHPPSTWTSTRRPAPTALGRRSRSSSRQSVLRQQNEVQSSLQKKSSQQSLRKAEASTSQVPLRKMTSQLSLGQRSNTGHAPSSPISKGHVPMPSGARPKAATSINGYVVPDMGCPATTMTEGKSAVRSLPLQTTTMAIDLEKNLPPLPALTPSNSRCNLRSQYSRQRTTSSSKLVGQKSFGVEPSSSSEVPSVPPLPTTSSAAPFSVSSTNASTDSLSTDSTSPSSITPVTPHTPHMPDTPCTPDAQFIAFPTAVRAPRPLHLPRVLSLSLSNPDLLFNSPATTTIQVSPITPRYHERPSVPASPVTPKSPNYNLLAARPRPRTGTGMTYRSSYGSTRTLKTASTNGLRNHPGSPADAPRVNGSTVATAVNGVVNENPSPVHEVSSANMAANISTLHAASMSRLRTPSTATRTSTNSTHASVGHANMSSPPLPS